MNWNITISAQNCSVLLTEQESSFLLTDIAKRDLPRRGRMEKGKALVLRGKLVGVVNSVVAGVAQGRFVGGAEHRGLLFVTDIALDLHLFVDLLHQSDHSWSPERV